VWDFSPNKALLKGLDHHGLVDEYYAGWSADKSKTLSIVRSLLPIFDKMEIPMARNSSRRKVLIIEDEPSIRNVLYVLLAGVGDEGDVAYTADHALSMLRQNLFDSVLLDFRCAPGPQTVSAITGLRPSLVGRVLVIAGEVSDPKTLERLERYAVPRVLRSRVTSDLWGRLRTLLGYAP
jgi:CheY-like chemotaxis protein